MGPRIRTLLTLSVLAGTSTSVLHAQHPAMPPGMTHEEHVAQMQKEADLKKRGAAAMGFDQDKTTHHFRLTSNGGAIEVGANDLFDEASRNRIRLHLKEIATEFAAGDFARPFATHGEMPPGVRTIQERTNVISFAYEDTSDGGRVRIETADSKAKSAIHQFLRYQITEHRTGDSVFVVK